MKRKVKSLIFYLLCAILIFSCTACHLGGKTTANLVSVREESVVMSIQETDGEANAFNALESLKEQGKITFEFVDSTYGAYVTSINGKAEMVISSTLNSSEGYTWSFYTSDMEYAYDYQSIEIDGRVCGLSSLGASSLIVKEGELYVWVYEYYSYEW